MCVFGLTGTAWHQGPPGHPPQEMSLGVLASQNGPAQEPRSSCIFNPPSATREEEEDDLEQGSAKEET